MNDTATDTVTEAKHPQNVHITKAMRDILIEFNAATGMSYNEFFRRAGAAALKKWREEGVLPPPMTDEELLETHKSGRRASDKGK